MATSRLFIESPVAPHVGSFVDLFVRLDTVNEPVNAIEGSLVIPSNFRVIEVLTGSSLVSFWIESPTASSTIRWSGMTPGGYHGSGTLFVIRAQVISQEQKSIQVKNLRLFRHDGKGTQIPISFISVSSPEVPIVPVDATPPVSFPLKVTRDPQMFDGKWFLVFQAQDKESGVLGYRVREGDGAWVTSTSPYLLQDQTRHSLISVEATDRASNHRTVVQKASGFFLNFRSPLLFGIIALGLLILLAGMVLVLRKKRN